MYKNKSNYREILNILKKEIELYPNHFLNNSGLKYVMICEVKFLIELFLQA